MEIEWDKIWFYGKQILIFQLCITIALLVMIYRYPEVIVRIMQRWLIYKSGFSVRRLKIDDGYTFEYMERGDIDSCKQSLLLIHGFTSTKDSFCRFAKYLPKRIHVVALDLPGHGGTSYTTDDHNLSSITNRINQFCVAKQLDVKKFHILGASLGGLIAGLFAKDYTEYLLSATLICPAGIKDDEMPLVETVYRETGKILLLPETDEAFQDLFDILLHKKVKLPSIVVRGIMKIRLRSHDFFLKVIRAMEQIEPRSILGAKLHSIDIPTLVIWGKHDQILDVSSACTIKERMPKVQVEILEDCGHTVIIERPRKSASLVTKFINSLEK